MKRHFPVLCFLLILFAITGAMVFEVSAASEPEITADNYTVTITEADSIKDIRFVLGKYSTTTEIRNAEGNVALSNAVVQKNSVDGKFVYEMPDGGVYSFWIRMQDGTNYIKVVDITTFIPKVSAYGVKITVEGLYEAKDFFIAKGEYNSYNEIKNNGYIVRVTPQKIAGKHSYTYTVTEPGLHTVLVRYNDGKEYIFHETLTVDEPVFDTNGLQVTVRNIPDIKVIRTAYGEYYTPGDTKRAPGARNFSNKAVIKDAESYMLQYRDEGIVTIVVEYNNGYLVIFHYNVQKKSPTLTQDDDTVTFSGLDGLLHIRYAQGIYESSSEIKAAEGSAVIKGSAAVDGEIKIMLEPGTYTFCAQYDDDSYNYYVITVESHDPTATNVHISCAFNSNMVIQRDEPLSVWGTADPSSGKVRVDFGGEYAVARVDEYGNWKATFKNTFAYNTNGQTLTVSGKDESISIYDVLVGDVYYVMGQSEVYYSMGELILDLSLSDRSSELQVDYDDTRNMRFYRISSKDYASLTGAAAQGSTAVFTDVYSGAYWMKPSDIAAQINAYAAFEPTDTSYDRDAVSSKVFSALGYTFAYNMTEKTNVPVGIIEIDAEDAPLIAFAPNELADKWGHDTLGSDGLYHYKLEAIEKSEVKTRYAYNQQIAPLSGLSCAGIIWAQDESDTYNTREVFGSQYSNGFANQFAELMEYYRSVFGNSDFPVYLFEMPACYSNNGANAYADTGALRTELGCVAQLLDDCYTLSASDLWFDGGWQNSLDAPIKHLYSYRLTDAVLAKSFNSGETKEVCGPVVSRVEYISNSKAYIYFDNAGSALTTSDDSGNVTGLEILIDLNGTSTWIPHEGKIITGKNVITVDAGSFPLYGVRYGRSTEGNHPFGRNLCNSHKMPAIAFVDYNVKESFELAIDSIGWDIYTPDRVTGYDYRYGPTIIDHGDGSMDAWFSCTGSNESDELDYFTYKHSEDGGKTWSKEKIVLSPTGLSEDRLSVCDPGAIYFDGYYYLGYTSTLDKAGYSNHVFVARSKNPDGPYEKWDGSTWGGSPSPLVTYQGHGDQWGMGEVSFVKVEDTIYIYYSLKCETGQYTLLSTADATDPNWPATAEYKGVALNWSAGQAAADVKYDTHTGKFIAAAIVNGNTENCYMALFTSEDGLNFRESGRAYTNLKAYAMNNGISGGPDGTFDSSTDKLYIAYAYGNNWGCWATRMAPVTLNLTKYPDLNSDRGKPDKVTYTPVDTERYIMGITTDPHYYIVNEGSSFEVKPYMFDDKMGRYPITETDKISFSSYDSSVVSFEGLEGTAVGTGRTLVTMTWGEFYVTFTVEVRAAGEDVSSPAIYSWSAQSPIINIDRSNMLHCYMIKGIAVTGAGVIGEAYNDPLDKAIFTPASYPVIYTGYDPSVISVDSMGVITPLNAGTTYVTVTIYGGKSFTVQINVK